MPLIIKPPISLDELSELKQTLPFVQACTPDQHGFVIFFQDTLQDSWGPKLIVLDDFDYSLFEVTGSAFKDDPLSVLVRLVHFLLPANDNGAAECIQLNIDNNKTILLCTDGASIRLLHHLKEVAMWTPDDFDSSADHTLRAFFKAISEK